MVMYHVAIGIEDEHGLAIRQERMYEDDQIIYLSPEQAVIVGQELINLGNQAMTSKAGEN